LTTQEKDTKRTLECCNDHADQRPAKSLCLEEATIVGSDDLAAKALQENKAQLRKALRTELMAELLASVDVCETEAEIDVIRTHIGHLMKIHRSTYTDQCQPETQSKPQSPPCQQLDKEEDVLDDGISLEEILDDLQGLDMLPRSVESALAMLADDEEENGLQWLSFEEEGEGQLTPFKQPALATIGNGVSVKTSLIPLSGNGLFATTGFCVGQSVTKYEGAVLGSRYEAAGCEVQTHIAFAKQAGLGNNLYIEGDRLPRHGHGGGSFANHSSQPNAEKVIRSGQVVLIAIKQIGSGDEILLNYGSKESIEVAFGIKRLIQDKDVDGRQSVSVVHVELAPEEDIEGADELDDAEEDTPPALVGGLINSLQEVFVIHENQAEFGPEALLDEFARIKECVNTATPGFQYISRASQNRKLVSKICGGAFHVYIRLYPCGVGTSLFSMKKQIIEAHYMGVGNISPEAMKNCLKAKNQSRDIVIDSTTKIARWFAAFESELANSQ
jgi:hypothetical protein